MWKQSNELPQKYLWVYRLVSWGIPTIFLVYLILEQLNGDIGFGNADRRWCWITSTHSSETEGSQMVYNSRGAWRQLFLFYFPIVLILIFNATIYVCIIQFLSKDPMNGTFKQKAAMYIAVVLWCPLWGFINRVIQMTDSNHKPSTPFTLLESVFDPLQVEVKYVMGKEMADILLHLKYSRCWMRLFMGQTGYPWLHARNNFFLRGFINRCHLQKKRMILRRVTHLRIWVVWSRVHLRAIRMISCVHLLRSIIYRHKSMWRDYTRTLCGKGITLHAINLSHSK